MPETRLPQTTATWHRSVHYAFAPVILTGVYGQQWIYICWRCCPSLLIPVCEPLTLALHGGLIRWFCILLFVVISDHCAQTLCFVLLHNSRAVFNFQHPGGLLFHGLEFNIRLNFGSSLPLLDILLWHIFYCCWIVLVQVCIVSKVSRAIACGHHKWILCIIIGG